MARRAARRQRNHNHNGNGSLANAPVAEIIGRQSAPQAQASIWRKTVDNTVPDYAYWDMLRRCKLPGYKLAGLFAQRIERVLAAWIFGEGVNITLNTESVAELDQDAVDYTNAQIKTFVDGLLDAGQDSEGDDPDVETQIGSMLPAIFRDAAGLGDQYVIVNADGTLSVPSPDTVEVIRDKLDYRRVLAVRVVTKLDEATISDEYRADGRSVTFDYMQNGSRVTTTENYANLIGRIPVIHIAYGRSGNETNGHSIHEALRPLYDQYDDVLEKMLDGVKLLGNPFLAFTGLEDISAVINLNRPVEYETYTDAGGNEVDRPALNIDRNSVFAIGKGGDAKFVAPPVGFTEDTKSALNVLFWLLFEHLGVPESVWGGELSSARATSETQLIQFVKELRGWQAENGGWIVRLCKIWLQYQALTDPQIIVAKLAASWPDALQGDKELLLKFIDFCLSKGLITMETALRLTNLVDDATKELPAAQAEAQARADAEQARFEAQAAAQAQANGNTNGSGANSSAVAQMEGGDSTGKSAAAIRAAIREEAERMVADA